eukprot:3449154-Alexandrium_andersonii.AAC.1
MGGRGPSSPNGPNGPFCGSESAEVGAPRKADPGAGGVVQSVAPPAPAYGRQCSGVCGFRAAERA